METSGFQLSQFERAPQIPGQIGLVDVKGIYDNVVNGLRAYESLASSGGRQAATDATLKLEAEKARSDLGLVEPEAKARLAKANLLSAESQATLPNVGILAQSRAATAGGILGTEQAAATERARENRLLQQAQTEEGTARTEIADALDLADYEEKSRALAKIRTKYPWLGLKQYKDLAGTVDLHHKTAVSEGQALASRESAESLGAQRAASALEVAKQRSTGSPSLQLFRALADAQEALDMEPDNIALQQHVATLQGMVNKQSAQAVGSLTPAQQQKFVERANAAKNAIVKYERDGQLLDRQISNVENLINQGAAVGGWSHTLFTQLKGPLTSALNAELKSLRAKMTLGGITELKASGGSLGQVSNYEDQMLSNAIAALDVENMTEEQFRRSLKTLRENRARARHDMEQAYEEDFGNQRKTPLPLGAFSTGAPRMSPSTSMSGKTGSTADLDAALKWTGSLGKK